MSLLEVLFRLEFVLSESVELPPSQWPILANKKVVNRLIETASLTDMESASPELHQSYLKCVAGFDPKKPYSSIKRLVDSGDYTICYARDYLNVRFPKKAQKFTELHDAIWKRVIEDDEDWQAELEGQEFTAMFGHDEDIADFAEFAEANDSMEDCDFPWTHLKLKPV
ncbi:hypothetical protein MPK67_gp222 [Erwinia phage pEa_SNUABM_32]|uniref:Uncharacterized protein n=1 Tax=Erwinia phage pEa_SNUABM_32 TaxID=2869555 RepID=A0AAE7XKH0_9CAUD|nr:hypothetical protein MPK67_gp222 [Erwinia phage pEa_SNUABM_32]QZE57095.1 hypothetical protein pEaSNUABM32_00222 [Erwinia phage pEa_SNUABM_32]